MLHHTPPGFVPSFSIYVTETASASIAGFFGTSKAAQEFADRVGLKKYVIRRSMWTVMGERARGTVVFTKKG